MSPAPARRATRDADPILYRIAPSDPHAHLFTVAMTIAHPDPEGQRLALPAWIPGSYMIREFARHVVALSARDARGVLRADKLDKHTWRAAPVRGARSLSIPSARPARPAFRKKRLWLTRRTAAPR